MPELIELTVLAPIIIALLKGFRAAGLPDAWTPLTAIGTGAVLAAVASAGGLLGFGLVAAAFGGALAGAGAVGLHQVPKQLQHRPPRETVTRGQPVADRDPDTTDR